MHENVLYYQIMKLWTPDVRIVQPQPTRSTDELTAIFMKANQSNNCTIHGSGISESIEGIYSK